MKLPLQCVLFDLDGTLADTIADIANAVNSVLLNHGFPPHQVLEYRMMVGEGFKNLMRRALPDSAVSDAQFFLEITEEATNAYGKHSLVETKPFDGIPKLLSGLSSHGLSLAILSNKPDLLVKSISKALFGSFYFIEVMGETEGRPRKPDPTAALEIAKKSGTEPSQWAYIGDSDIDMKTAISSGMVPFGATWGYRSEADLIASGARYMLRSPLDLLEYII